MSQALRIACDARIREYMAKVEELEQDKANYYGKWRDTEEKLLKSRQTIKRCAQTIAYQGRRIQELKDAIEQCGT